MPQNLREVVEMTVSTSPVHRSWEGIVEAVQIISISASRSVSSKIVQVPVPQIFARDRRVAPTSRLYGKSR